MSSSQDIAPSGLEAVFSDLRPALIRRARAMGVGEDAEDVVQDVWLRLRDVRTPIANPQAFLYRIIYTTVLDRKRSARRTAARDGAWRASGAGDPRDADITLDDAERQLIARETLARVEARLTALGEPTNSIFRRHRLGGETQRSIAEDLGLGLSTVEKYLRRAYAAVLGVRGDREV
jgi:RNA polymerase sigma factor (sigma-70 family)